MDTMSVACGQRATPSCQGKATLAWAVTFQRGEEPADREEESARYLYAFHVHGLVG
jgi:hypothetical protein